MLLHKLKSLKRQFLANGSESNKIKVREFDVTIFKCCIELKVNVSITFARTFGGIFDSVQHDKLA